MPIITTSLIHPTMVAKIRKGLKLAALCDGHKMGGHANRVYIPNRKGHNIMRLNWVGGRQGYIVYGAESRDITRIVRAALASVVVAREPVTPSLTPIEKDGKVVGFKRRTLHKVFNYGTVAAVACVCLSLTACQSSGAMTAFYGVVGSLFT